MLCPMDPDEPPVETFYVDALSASAEVAAAEPPPRLEVRSEASAFVWACVRRWPALHRSFSLLFKSWLVDEARLITRAVAELAINAAWVVQGRATKKGLYATADERAKALEAESRSITLKWWTAMNAHIARWRPVPRSITWLARRARVEDEPAQPPVARAV